MTQHLATLKLTSARKQRALPDVVRRRNKLLKKLMEQRDLALAHNEGRNYAPKRLRTVLDKETDPRSVRMLTVTIQSSFSRQRNPVVVFDRGTWPGKWRIKPL